MSTLTFPYSFVPNTNADANQVNSDFSAVATVVNGNLEASTNVRVAAPISQTSSALLQGSANTLARSDHAHLIQCTEQRTSDPTTGNFIGRRYFNTSTLKERLCIATGGVGTWVTMGNYSAADLPAHASNHTTGSDLINPPSVLATRTATQSITSATDTAIAFNATDTYDTDTMHDPVTNNSRITFTHAGVYAYWAMGWFAASNAGTRRGYIRLNGAAGAIFEHFDNAPAGASTCPIHVQGVYKFAAADFIEFFVAQTSGGPLNFTQTSNAGGGSQGMLFGATWLGTGN